MKKIICILGLLTYSTSVMSEIVEKSADEWRVENGFMPDNPRLIGNYQIDDCIQQGFIAADMLKHKFQGISSLKSEIDFAKSFHKEGRDSNHFIERKYKIRMEIIDQIYNRTYLQLSYNLSTENDRYNAVVIAAAERIAECIGLNEK